ncbi:uncharacterized protein NEMAJ01_1745 [Nematocida major]|uniref:uncharacterized protein n=1 Tax=Nematocida major TaxID=1912982 RepID=UPI002008E4DB|nr:uncharacterized protein NEMAJ01_1745 [Nematocida major]KAH9386849.1 hypothetical protein NEMAJ01_1745 [Nematocida major]
MQREQMHSPSQAKFKVSIQKSPELTREIQEKLQELNEEKDAIQKSILVFKILWKKIMVQCVGVTTKYVLNSIMKLASTLLFINLTKILDSPISADVLLDSVMDGVEDTIRILTSSKLEGCGEQANQVYSAASLTKLSMLISILGVVFDCVNHEIEEIEPSAQTIFGLKDYIRQINGILLRISKEKKNRVLKRIVENAFKLTSSFPMKDFKNRSLYIPDDEILYILAKEEKSLSIVEADLNELYVILDEEACCFERPTQRNCEMQDNLDLDERVESSSRFRYFNKRLGESLRSLKVQSAPSRMELDAALLVEEVDDSVDHLRARHTRSMSIPIDKAARDLIEAREQNQCVVTAADAQESPKTIDSALSNWFSSIHKAVIEKIAIICCLACAVMCMTAVFLATCIDTRKL